MSDETTTGEHWRDCWQEHIECAEGMIRDQAEDIVTLDTALAESKAREDAAEAENARLRERVAALEAAGETMLDLLTGHTHGVTISPQAVRDALGDWLAALALAGEGQA